MANTEKCIIIPKADSKRYYLYLFIFCSSIRYLIPRILENYIEKREKEEYYYKGKSYSDILSNFTGDFLTGIIILYNKCKRDSRNEIRNIQGLETKKEMRKRFWFYLFMIAVIDFIAQLCLTNFLISYIIPNIMIENKGTFIEEEDLYFVVLIDIISRYLFSLLFLKSYFYKHHYVSIFITIVGFILLSIENINDIYKENEVNYKKFFLIQYIFMNIIYSLEDVLNKICLNKLIIRPYELMFKKSLFQIFFVILITCFDWSALKQYFKVSIDIFYIFYRLIFIISNIFRTWSLITIIEKISPNHLSVLKSSEFSAQFIIHLIYLAVEKYILKKTNLDNDHLSLNFIFFGGICILFSIFGSIIHNEMIIINICGLLECTDYYKTEMKEFHGNDEDLENNNNQNPEKDLLLNDSVDNE